MKWSVAFAVVFNLLLPILLRGAENPVTASIDESGGGSAISADFSGLSFEITACEPGAGGVRYFRPDNRPLISLFHTLGIRNLRVGGNSSDRDAHSLPTHTDIDSLFQFAKAADVRVIYCLRLFHGDADADAATAKFIMDHYGPQLECFSIGQEPSAYPRSKIDTRPSDERMGASAEKYAYETYRDQWRRFAGKIIGAVPDVKFGGPSVHNNGSWARRFIDDFGKGYRVTLITEHLYPGGAGGKVRTPEIGRDRMLSPDFVRVYQKLYDSFVPQAVDAGLPYRLEEVNNFFNGGAADVSNTFASALWGLDFMYWWAEHGAQGVNFHTGDRVAAGATIRVSKYTAFFSTAKGFSVRPLGYAIKAFDLAGHGELLPVKVDAPENADIDIFAVCGKNGQLFVTAINKSHGEAATDFAMTLKTAHHYVRVGSMVLSTPKSDVAATEGITLGGGEIAEDGTWNGNWSAVRGDRNDEITVRVPAASALILKLTP